MKHPNNTLLGFGSLRRFKSSLMVGPALFAILALTACGQNENRPTFDGQDFRAKLSKVEKVEHLNKLEDALLKKLDRLRNEKEKLKEEKASA